MREIKYVDALREALAEEMRREPTVFVFGEDIELGYVYGVTKGLVDEFGPERVRDTPICEQTIVGVAVGAAMMGMRPVPEIMFSDLLFLCMDQICNQAAKLRYMSGGQFSMPLVIRTPGGRWASFAAQHSQSVQAMFMQVPGLKVAVPATPFDAKGLLKAAVRDENPVLFVEQKMLYQNVGPVPEEEYLVPLGKAKVHRQGGDLTIVAIGRMLGEALKAAETLDTAGIQATVLDPRTLVPLDSEAILDAVSKTHRIMIVEEGPKRGGVGAEIAALVSEEILDELDAPIGRVAASDCPIPMSPPLEEQVFPDHRDIVATARRIVGAA
jgi:pyruvate/2-oxoglutarate/acetoin dehydrogenase E1 component